MGKKRVDPLKEVNFHCRECGHKFSSEPGRVIDASVQDYHPWEYISDCPSCSKEAQQAGWEKGLLSAYAHATGPVTDEGKRRCKFNALKHGLTATTATYYPARPGGYPHCNKCEYLPEKECLTTGGCLKRTELLLRHQMAFEANDPSKLKSYRGTTQAHIQAMIEDMFLAIAQDGGPRIKSVEWYYDKEGILHLAQYLDSETGETIQIEKIEAHPLLKPLIDFISKNKMTLEDMGMTPKSHDEQDQIKGFLDQKGTDQQHSIEYQQQSQASLDRLLQLVNNSYTPAREPVIMDAEVITDG